MRFLSVILVLFIANASWAIDPPEVIKQKLEAVRKILSEEIYNQSQAKAELMKLAELELTGMNVSNQTRSILFYGGEGSGRSSLIKAYGKAMDHPVWEVPIEIYSAASSDKFVEEFKIKMVENPRTLILIGELEMVSGEVMGHILSIQSGKSTIGASAETLLAFTTNKGSEYITNWVQAVMVEPIKPVGYMNLTTREKIEKLAEFKLPQRSIPKSSSTNALKSAGLAPVFLENISVIAPMFPPNADEFWYFFGKFFNEGVAAYSAKYDVKVFMSKKNVTTMVETIYQQYYYDGITHVQIKKLVDATLETTFLDAVMSGKIPNQAKYLRLLFDSPKLISAYCSSRLKGRAQGDSDEPNSPKTGPVRFDPK